MSNPFHPFFLYINKRQLINALTSLISVAVTLILVSYFSVSIAEVDFLVFIAEVAVF